MKLLDNGATGIHFLVLKTKFPPLISTGRHTMQHEPSQILVCYTPKISLYNFHHFGISVWFNAVLGQIQ